MDLYWKEKEKPKQKTFILVLYPLKKKLKHTSPNGKQYMNCADDTKVIKPWRIQTIGSISSSKNIMIP